MNAHRYRFCIGVLPFMSCVICSVKEVVPLDIEEINPSYLTLEEAKEKIDQLLAALQAIVDE